MGQTKTTTIEVGYRVSTLAMELLGDDLDRAMKVVAEMAIDLIREAENDGAPTGAKFVGAMPVEPDRPRDSIYTFHGKRIGEDKWDVIVDRGYLTTIERGLGELPPAVRDALGERLHDAKLAGRCLPMRVQIDCAFKHHPVQSDDPR